MFDSTYVPITRLATVQAWCLGCGNDLVFAHSNGWYLDATGRDHCPVAVVGDPVYSHVAAASSVPAEGVLGVEA
jgi:hypothetical protein